MVIRIDVDKLVEGIKEQLIQIVDKERKTENDKLTTTNK